MGYTIEDFRKGIMVEEALDYMTPDDVFKKFSPDDLLQKIPAQERLKGLSAEEIKAYLKTLSKPKKTKAKPKKKAETAD